MTEDKGNFVFAKDHLPVILAVDDNKTSLVALESNLKKIKCRTILAKNLSEAKIFLDKYHKDIDLILLDRMLGDDDGLTLINWINEQKYDNPPLVIIQTALDKAKDISEAIDIGVFYYLIKPIKFELLKSVIISATKEAKRKKTLSRELKKHKTSFNLINEVKFVIRNLDEVDSVSCFIANCFPEPSKVLPAIVELLVNAIEHGNLNISFEEKTELIQSGKWRKIIDKKLESPENNKKKVSITFTQQKGKYFLKIVDDGKGFDWKQYLSLSPSRALETHGRGIARSRVIFSNLVYNKLGNQVVAVIDPDKKTIDW